MRPLGEKTNIYDYASFTVASSTTDKDVKDTEATSFANWTSSYGLIEITTTEDITVKFNKTTNPAITITSSMSPYVRNDLIIDQIYISTGVAAADVTIYGNNI